MTITLVSSVNRYTGVAADTKPTGVPAGSRFFERDTGSEYVYDGSAWGAVATGGTLGAGDNNIGNVDVVTLPADPAGANADVAVEGDTAGSWSAKLRGINKVLGAVADAVVAAGAAGSISAKLRRVTQGLEDLKSLIVLAAGEAHIGQIGGAVIVARVEKTRPNDTNAYAANDAISNATSGAELWEFTVGRTATGSGTIVGAEFATDDPACTARFELDLYDDTITAPNDNAEATRLYANQGKFLKTIAFPAAAKKTTNSTQAEAKNDDVRIPFKCVGNSKIYGVLRILDADTPVAQAKYRVTLPAFPD